MKAFRAIAGAGLVAGTLDITAATTYWYLMRHMAPARLLRGIAAGLLGPSARDGGNPMALLGLALHFTIAFGSATVFFPLRLQIPLLLYRPLDARPLYDVADYLSL